MHVEIVIFVLAKGLERDSRERKSRERKRRGRVGERVEIGKREGLCRKCRFVFRAKRDWGRGEAYGFVNQGKKA